MTTPLGLGVPESSGSAERAIPTLVQERREALEQDRRGHLDAIRQHERELQICQTWLAATEAEIAGIDLAVSAYDASAPASGNAVGRKPRAARRNIRAMVLQAVKTAPHGASVAALVSGLGTRPALVRSALDHWQGRGEVTMRNDVARAAGAVELDDSR